MLAIVLALARFQGTREHLGSFREGFPVGQDLSEVDPMMVPVSLPQKLSPTSCLKQYFWQHLYHHTLLYFFTAITVTKR